MNGVGGVRGADKRQRTGSEVSERHRCQVSGHDARTCLCGIRVDYTRFSKRVASDQQVILQFRRRVESKAYKATKFSATLLARVLYDIR